MSSERPTSVASKPEQISKRHEPVSSGAPRGQSPDSSPSTILPGSQLPREASPRVPTILGTLGISSITPRSKTSPSNGYDTLPQIPAPQKRNAFSELMSPKRKQSKPTSDPSSSMASKTTTNPRNTNDRKEGLLAYIQDPTSYPPSRVIYHTSDFVVINDLYPKASLHLLLLPRDPTKYDLHPFVALAEPVFLESVRTEIGKITALAASELRRRFGAGSASDRPLLDAMDAADDELETAIFPRGRDWAAELLVGVHAHPSMNHLHIHLLSKDRYSECVKHRKHYNSFATPFFVPLKDFPLAEDDVRRHPGREGYLKSDFVCWRCGKGFGNKFKELKVHLAEEFEAWKKD